MKHLATIFSCLIITLNCLQSKAQSVSLISDTIVISTGGAAETYFDTLATTSAPVTFVWKVTGCNFPADWMVPARSGMCDNALCRTLATLWPSGMVCTSTSYPAMDTGILDLVLDLSTATSTGCYYVTVRLHNQAIPADTAVETWGVCFSGSTLSTKRMNTGESAILYPNPVSDVLYVYSDIATGGTAVVYDLLGQVVAKQRCDAGQGTISMSGYVKGLYLLRLYDTNRNVLATQRFMKD